MGNNNTVFFDDSLTLARHLKSRDPEISPLRLQKTMYFLFAFYSKQFGALHVDDEKVEEGIFEGSNEESYPKYLFDEEFEAWKFGPVLRSVYAENKSGRLEPEEWKPNGYQGEQVLEMFDEAIEAINKLGDFELVERTHEDSAWRKALKDTGVPEKMSKEDIVNDYK